MADFAYFNPKEFKLWRELSNYKICLSIENLEKLEKLHNKLIINDATISGFIEPDIGSELTAITFLGDERLGKYTKYLPLAGKI